MRSKSTFLFLAAILLASCAAPTPQPTVTAQTSEVLTPTQTPTSTQIVIPTSTHTPAPTLPIYDAEVDSMEEFNFPWAWEKGKVVAVDDLYGAGAATLEIVDVKVAEPGMQFEYEEFRTASQPSGSMAGERVERLSLINTTVEQVSLVKVDLTDNSQVSDGNWVVMRLGTLINGQHTSFEIWMGGNAYMGFTGENVFANWNPGDKVGVVALSYFPKNAITFDEYNEEIYVAGLGDDDIPVAKLDFLGTGFTEIDRAGILNVVKQGGVLGKGEVSVDGLSRRP